MLLNMFAEVTARIALALSIASNSTGADLDYLMKTAARESSFRVEAKATTSSATGLFQFIESTWLRTLKEDGPRFGLADYADKIFVTRSGKYYVPDPTAREDILRLRHDPNVSALMAGAYAKRNAELLASEIGRQPTAGELYLAHFLGPRDAIAMIRIKQNNAWEQAAANFPEAAAANRSIFFDGARMRSVGEVYDRLTADYRQGASKPMPVDGNAGVGKVQSANEASLMPDSPFAQAFGKARRRETFRIAPDGSWIPVQPSWEATTAHAVSDAPAASKPLAAWETSVKASAPLAGFPEPMGLRGQQTNSTVGFIAELLPDQLASGTNASWQFGFGDDRRAPR